MAYQGTSIVDYLKSVGKSSDYSSRSTLAQEQGISNYTGTAEQNTQLLGKLNQPQEPQKPQENQGWQQSPFAQDATFGQLNQLVPEPDENIDVEKGTDSLLKGSQSGWFKKFQNMYKSGQTTLQNSIDMVNNRLMEITEEEKTAKEQQVTSAAEGLKEAKDSLSGQALYDTFAKKEGLKEKRDKLLKLGNKMAILTNAYEESVMATENSGITIGQSRGELARKQREYASKATMLQAQASIINDDLESAKESVKMFYEDARDERINEIKRYQDLLLVATQAKLNLSQQDRKDVKNILTQLQEEQVKQEDNKDKIMALMIDPSTAEAFFSSGASLDDSYETILEKMSPYMSQFAKEERSKGMGIGTTKDEKTIWTTPDGTEIDPTTIEGASYLKDQGYSYGEIYTWYDVNMPSMTTGAIKSLLKDAGIKETEITDKATIDNLIEKMKNTISKDSSARNAINTMLDNNQIVTKTKTYSLTQEQSNRIKNEIKKPISKAWDWIKGIFK